MFARQVLDLATAARPSAETLLTVRGPQSIP
jgi:hypothetical protein